MTQHETVRTIGYHRLFNARQDEAVQSHKETGAFSVHHVNLELALPPFLVV